MAIHDSLTKKKKKKWKKVEKIEKKKVERKAQKHNLIKQDCRFKQQQQLQLQKHSFVFKCILFVYFSNNPAWTKMDNKKQKKKKIKKIVLVERTVGNK